MFNIRGASLRVLSHQHLSPSVQEFENEAGGVRRKPWPDTLLTAAAALGVEPGECLYVGDSEVDVLTAGRAGMDCATVLWGFRSREELEQAGAKLFFNTPEELGEFILKRED